MDTAIGAKFGRWTVTGKDGRKFTVRCDCGTHSRAFPFDLRKGKTIMCRTCSTDLKRGMKRPEITLHGLSDSPTQWVWSDMKRRCLERHRRGYENYGGRGIRVCERWVFGDGSLSGFSCFLADMGERPSNAHQLDRIDNDGDYTPSNCRWIHRTQQNYNKRNTFRFNVHGRTFTLEQAEKEFGIRKGTLYQRLHTRKLPPEMAIRKRSRDAAAPR